MRGASLSPEGTATDVQRWTFVAALRDARAFRELRIENPVRSLSTRLGKPTETNPAVGMSGMGKQRQPASGFDWLPPLQPTRQSLPAGKARIHRMALGSESGERNEAGPMPALAEAMADQWGALPVLTTRRRAADA